ncbi:MAG: 50S ribosomal protein L4 [Deltaproteobacteria bacterium]|nr:50S ribosomal protein L4 [Deltaproteobacteria bacterium]
MAIQVIDQNNKKVGEVALAGNESEKVNKAVLYYAIKATRNNQRHGTAAVKDRSDVKLTNKKIYRQKGTGNARHGARSANIFVGGGSAHGPRPRSYFEKQNKKFKAKSYQEIFKYLIQNNGLFVVEGFKFKKPSTKEAAKFLSGINVNKALVVLPKEEANAQLSFRNIRDVKVVNEENISFLELARYENVVMLAKTFESIKGRYAL